MNVRVNFPQAGVIDIDHPMFRRDDENCRRFVLAIFSVDAVSRVMRVAPEQIQPAPDSISTTGRRFIEGFARVGEELFILLDVDQLLDPANLDEVHRASNQFTTAGI